MTTPPVYDPNVDITPTQPNNSADIIEQNDYNFPIRDLELGRDPAGEAGRGSFDLINLDDFTEDQKEFLINQAIAKQQQSTTLSPDIANQNVVPPATLSPDIANQNVVPQAVTNLNNVPQLSPVLEDDIRAFGTQSNNMNSMEESPAIKQLKELTYGGRAQTFPNTNVAYESALLGIKTAHDEFECLAQCYQNKDCELYTYQPDGKNCYLHPKSDKPFESSDYSMSGRIIRN